MVRKNRAGTIALGAPDGGSFSPAKSECPPEKAPELSVTERKHLATLLELLVPSVLFGIGVWTVVVGQHRFPW